MLVEARGNDKHCRGARCAPGKFPQAGSRSHRLDRSRGSKSGAESRRDKVNEATRVEGDMGTYTYTRLVEALLRPGSQFEGVEGVRAYDEESACEGRRA